MRHFRRVRNDSMVITKSLLSENRTKERGIRYPTDFMNVSGKQCFRKTCFISGKYEMIHPMFQENNVSGKHVSFQADTK